MLQTIDGRDVFVVELTGFPKENLPIKCTDAEERPYAIALDSGIRAGLVDSAGKWGIYITTRGKAETLVFNCYKIKE